MYGIVVKKIRHSCQKLYEGIISLERYKAWPIIYFLRKSGTDSLVE